MSGGLQESSSLELQKETGVYSSCSLEFKVLGLGLRFADVLVMDDNLGVAVPSNENSGYILLQRF